MFLNNQKGESLVEIIVSMILLVVIVLAASTIIIYSINASNVSLDIVENMNTDIVGVVNGDINMSEVTPFLYDAKITFRITNDSGMSTITPKKEYKIADKASGFITKHGVISFGIFD